MRFFDIVLAGALAASAYAQSKIAITSAPKNVQAGSSVTIKWSGGDSSAPVTITLREGPSNNLNTITTLTTSGTGGSYTWDVPSSVADASDYAFQISQTSGGTTSTNYWGPIAIAGGTGTLSTSSASASASTTSGSTSSASVSSTTSESTVTTTSGSSTSVSTTTTTSGSTRSASTSGSSSTTSSSSTSSASTAAAPSGSGAASNLKSNAALMVGAAAAIAYIA